MDRLFVEKPAGYFGVVSGPIMPDDLVLDWTSGVWRRHDAPDWTSQVADAADAVAVCRKAGLDPDWSKNAVRRTVKLPRGNNAEDGVAGSGPAIVVNENIPEGRIAVVSGGQASLFDLCADN